MRKIYYLIVIVFLMIISTGCVKLNINMDIKKDKSMVLTIVYAFDKTMFKDQSILTDEQIKQYEDSGYKVSHYSDDKMQGFTLSMEVPNIDEVSIDNDVIYNLSGDPNGNMYFFKVEKGFFKNTYTAVFKFNSADSGVDLDDYELADEAENDLSLDNFDFSSLAASTLDMNFSVNLPYGAIENNATKVENGNKKLMWNLVLNNEQSINFKFAIYNMGIIYIGAGILLIIVVIILMFKKSGKNKKETVEISEARIEIKNDVDNNITPEPILKSKANVMEEQDN